MTMLISAVVLAVVGITGNLLVAFQIRDRLDRIATVLEKK